MQDEAEKIPAEFALPDESPAGITRKEIRKILLVCVGWLWVLAYGVLWSLEPWQRPLLAEISDERAYLVLSCAGLLALVLFPWQWRSLADVARKFVILVAGGALLLGVLPVLCGHLAANRLKSMLDAEISNHAGSLGLGWRTAPPTFANKIHDALEQIGVDLPHWLSPRARTRLFQPAHALIAASRRPIRMKMADIMVRDATRADYLMAYWKEYFPSFTGPDVTLECRREWLGNLDIQSKRTGASLSTRQASLLMMALIILTDPPEFERWRIPVRDAMIGLREPLIHRWSGASQTFWYRSLDALLALDPPESWTRLVAPMVADGDAFKQAMEVPVCGLVGNFDAFLSIFEITTDRYDLFLYWQSAGESLDAYPDSIDAATAERIRNWRRDTLFRWLMALGDGSKHDLTQRNISVHHVLHRYPSPLTDVQQAQLAGYARSKIDAMRQVPEDDRDAVSGYLEELRYILPCLAGKHADGLCSSLIPMLLELERYSQESQRGYSFNPSWVDCLWFCLPRMTEEQKLLLRNRLTIRMANLSISDRTGRMMLYVDAWSQYPALPRSHWLAMAWSHGFPWRISSGEPSEYTRPSEDAPLYTVPPFSEEDVDAFISLLEFILRSGQGKGMQSISGTRSGGDNQSAYRYENAIRLRMANLGIRAGSDPVWLVKALKADLAGMGLYRMDAEIVRTLLKIAKQRKYDYQLYIVHTELSARLWSEVLKDPRWASEVVGDCLQGAYHETVLSSLILAIEHTTPDEEVVRTVWDALRAGSHTGPLRRMIFGALFRLSHLVSESERLAMRRDYRDAKPGWRIAIDRNEWGYHDTSNDYISISDASVTYPQGFDPNPLAHVGGGLGIPWEEDALSAEKSWSTMVDRQLYSQPLVDTSTHRRELFAYLAFGFEWGNPMPYSRLSQPKPILSTPLPPTPWQRARSLHRKRPDLKFR